MHIPTLSYTVHMVHVEARSSQLGSGVSLQAMAGCQTMADRRTSLPGGTYSMVHEIYTQLRHGWVMHTVNAWMHNYLPRFCVDVINYLCFKLNVGLAILFLLIVTHDYIYVARKKTAVLLFVVIDNVKQVLSYHFFLCKLASVIPFRTLEQSQLIVA